MLPTTKFTLVEVANAPTVTVTPGNSSVTLSGNYTLAMLDAGTVGEQLPDGQTRHWLENGVSVSGAYAFPVVLPTVDSYDTPGSTVSNASAVAITSYAGPGPAAGSGPHRCVVICIHYTNAYPTHNLLVT